MKMITWTARLTCLFFILATAISHAPAADEETPVKTIDPTLSAGQDAYMNDQAVANLALVAKTLTEFPPQLPEPLQRRLALQMLDLVLHDTHASERQPQRDFLAGRLAATVEAIEKTTVSEGAMIWKLYNDGFVVRTPSVTLGFDLIRTPPYMRDATPETPDVIDRLVAQCDVLFISHNHGDHADPYIAQAFLDAGKPVVAPPDTWPSQPVYDKITHLARVANGRQSLPIQGGKTALKVVIYPGHQQITATGTTEDNVALVQTPEGMSFCQTGDQAWMDDFKWIDTVGEHQRVDVLMPNCWTPDMVRVIKGFGPRLVIPGHENEMGHPIDSRIPFWKTYAAAKGASAPVMPMAWGESYHYMPEK